MKIGDLVRSKYNIGQRSSRWNSLAIVVGFDCEGDLYLRYVNPTKDWENENDLDYKRSWELVNAAN